MGTYVLVHGAGQGSALVLEPGQSCWDLLLGPFHDAGADRPEWMVRR
jgi:hypothetical protein